MSSLEEATDRRVGRDADPEGCDERNRYIVSVMFHSPDDSLEMGITSVLCGDVRQNDFDLVFESLLDIDQDKVEPDRFYKITVLENSTYLHDVHAWDTHYDIVHIHDATDESDFEIPL